MKKLMCMLVISGFFIVSPMTSFAGGHGKKSCSKSDCEAKKCKVAMLKSTMMAYWAHKNDLGLTEDQMSQLADIKHDGMKQLIRESAEVKVIKVDLKTAMWEAQIDTGVVNGLIEKKYAAKEQLAKTYVKALADAQKVLTDDQRGMMLEIKGQEYLSKAGYGSGCSKSSGKICPITGKALEGKGSQKGSGTE